MIISIVNQKGGVGKTTTAVNLGAALANRGHSTLLVDIDPQANATSGLGVPEGDRYPSIYEVLRSDASAADVLQSTNQKNFNILPSTPDLAGASVELMDMEGREERLKLALNPLDDYFDYILIDGPPSLGILTMNALVASNYVLIPVQCEYYALEGLGQLLETISLVKNNLQPDLEVLGSVLTLFDRRVRVAHDVVREVKEHFPGKVFDTIIPRNIRLAEAPSYGQNIFEYEQNSQGASSYVQLADELHNYVMEITKQVKEETL